MSKAFILQILCNKLLLILNCAVKKQIKSQLKKIVPETVNFGSQILTKPKKKSRNTTKYHNISQYLLFPVVVGFGLIFYYFIFYIHNIFTTNFK